MSFQRYPKYKDSGVEWLGEVPQHWQVRRLRFLCAIQTGERDTVDAVDDGLYPFFVRSQTVERINSYSFDCEAILTAGDGAGVGKVFHYYTGAFECHQRVYMLNRFREVSGQFLFHFLRENFYKVALEGGARSTVDSLRRPLFGSFPVAFPAAQEQRSIVEFAEREWTRIERLVCEQERLLELLKEKRLAAIAHVVTKGLKNDALSRRSGIEWLGQIPQHWHVERGRFLFMKLDLPPEADDGVVTAFRDGQVTLRENRRTDGFTLAVLEAGYQRVRTGDLVIHGMDAFAGAIGVSDSTGKCTPEYVVLTPARSEIDSRYYAFVLRLMAQRGFISVICPSVRERAPRFRFEAFRDVGLPVPPLTEQQDILRAIDTLNGRLDPLVLETRRAIDLLRERRTAVISAAVTGKIDVRSLGEGTAA